MEMERTILRAGTTPKARQHRHRKTQPARSPRPWRWKIAGRSAMTLLQRPKRLMQGRDPGCCRHGLNFKSVRQLYSASAWAAGQPRAYLLAWKIKTCPRRSRQVVVGRAIFKNCSRSLRGRCELGRGVDGRGRKPAREVRAGDMLKVMNDSGEFEIEVRLLSELRGPLTAQAALSRNRPLTEGRATVADRRLMLAA